MLHLLRPLAPRVSALAPLRCHWNLRRSQDCFLLPGESYEILSGDLVVGTGPTPINGDLVQVHHRGRFLDGHRIPLSDSHEWGVPVTFRLGAGWVIPAWDEAVATMHVGGRRKIIAPPDQAYGARGTQYIPPASTLVYELELVHVGPIDGFREPGEEEVRDAQESADAAERLQQLRDRDPLLRDMVVLGADGEPAAPTDPPPRE